VALLAAPINFLHMEILPHELNALNSHDTENETIASQSCEAPSPVQQENLHLDHEGSSSGSNQ
jgi:hypothetical protein